MQGNNYEHLNETQQSWLLFPEALKKKGRKKQSVDLGCMVCSRKAFKWSLISIGIAFLVIALPTIIVKAIPKHKSRPPAPDDYTRALHKALLFFNAQKCKSSLKSN
ncbi:unnamed protein product [Linum tenue]|uniref:Uncharacterized protein n=1 Tax=Linum tenue TaxID=586396 RepID=A0AAV0IYS6_9ROSI|nr:unnamed protein product [Linum tenue]